MRRVAYVSADPGVPVFGSKGASIHVQAICRELLRSGAEVHLITTRTGGEMPVDLAAIPGLIVHLLPTVAGAPGEHREASARAAADEAAVVLDAVHRAAPLDLVYERYSLWSEAAMRWAHRSCVPSILEVNAPLIDEQAEHRVLAGRHLAEGVAGRAFAAADSIVAVSDPVAAWVRERAAAHSPITVVDNGVDTTRIRPAEPPSADSGVFTVGFVGTLKPWHGVEVLLDAAARLSRTGGVHLRLIGDGPMREDLRAQAARLCIADRVELVGAVHPQDMPAHLATLDVAVAPYPELEGFYFSPLKVYEYLAAGLPVVASDIGPVPRILDGGRLGVLVRPGDAHELAAALAGLRADPERREDLARAGRAAAVARHDWSLVLRRILATVPDRTAAAADRGARVPLLGFGARA